MTTLKGTKALMERVDGDEYMETIHGRYKEEKTPAAYKGVSSSPAAGRQLATTRGLTYAPH